MPAFVYTLSNFLYIFCQVRMPYLTGILQSRPNHREIKLKETVSISIKIKAAVEYTNDPSSFCTDDIRESVDSLYTDDTDETHVIRVQND